MPGRVDEFKPNPWDQSAPKMGTGRAAGIDRWNRPPPVWTAAEDRVLLDHVAQFWPCGWAQCAAKMGTGRSGRAVQCRWAEICDSEAGLAALCRAPVVPVAVPNRPGAWTDAEDKAILDHVARSGPGQWANSMGNLRTGRTAEAAHTRWHKWLKGTKEGQLALAEARANKEASSKQRMQSRERGSYSNKPIYQRGANGDVVVVPSHNAPAAAEGRADAAAPPPSPSSEGGDDGGDDDGDHDIVEGGDEVHGNGVGNGSPLGRAPDQPSVEEEERVGEAAEAGGDFPSCSTDRLDLRARRALIEESDDAQLYRASGYKRQRDA